MWDPVIDHLRLQPSPQDSAGIAFTVRMFTKILLTLDPPLVSVSSFCSGRPLQVVGMDLCSVERAESPISQVGASRMSAWF